MNILSKRVQITTISITTEELLKNFRESINDIIWDNRPNNKTEISEAIDEVNRNMSILREATVALITGDPDGIIELFNDGFTMMLLGTAHETLEKCDLSGKAVQVIVTDHRNNSIIIPNHKLEY